MEDTFLYRELFGLGKLFVNAQNQRVYSFIFQFSASNLGNNLPLHIKQATTNLKFQDSSQNISVQFIILYILYSFVPLSA